MNKDTYNKYLNNGFQLIEIHQTSGEPIREYTVQDMCSRASDPYVEGKCYGVMPSKDTLIIKVDSESGEESLKKLEADLLINELIPTVQIATGGYHYYVKCNELIKFNQSMYPDIEFISYREDCIKYVIGGGQTIYINDEPCVYMLLDEEVTIHTVEGITEVLEVDTVPTVVKKKKVKPSIMLCTIYPEPIHKPYIEKHLKAVCFVRNHFLRQAIELNVHTKDEMEKIVKGVELTRIKKLEENNWLNECNSKSLQTAIHWLYYDFLNFFKKRKEYPRYDFDSYDYPSFTVNGAKVINNELFIPKFPSEGIKIGDDVDIPEDIIIKKVKIVIEDDKYIAQLHYVLDE